MTEYVIVDALGLYWTGWKWSIQRDQAQPFASKTAATLAAFEANLQGYRIELVKPVSARVEAR